MLKCLCGLQQTVENSYRDGNTAHFICVLRNLWIKKQQLELAMEQWTGSKLGKDPPGVPTVSQVPVG